MTSPLRRVLFVVTLGAALALPVLVHFALDAGSRHRGLRLELADLQREHRELPELARHIEGFRAHAALLEDFSAAAERAGVGPAHWETHQVAIDKMFVPYAELEKFLADMGPSRDSYFVPESLVMQVRPTVTHGDVEAAGGRDEPFEGGVDLSLSGRFLVER